MRAIKGFKSEKNCHELRNTCGNHCLWTQFTAPNTGQRSHTWKNDPETTPSSLGQSSFQTDRGKVQTVLRSEKSKSEILFGKLRGHVLRAKYKRHHPACYQHSVQKTESLMVCGIGAYGSDSLHIWIGTIKVKYKATKAAAFSKRQRISQQDHAKLNAASIKTTWLHSRRVRVLNWLSCSADLSNENIWLIMNEHSDKEGSGLWSN